MKKTYLAEFLGTFALALAVFLGISHGPGLAIPVPLLAALVVGVFVYTIGPISGCHLNPAVTLGVLSLQKIAPRDAIGYIVSQFVGAALALAVGASVVGHQLAATAAPFAMPVFFAEVIGTFLLTFGIASVVFGKTPTSASGQVIGGSLLVGVMAASLAGSAGILNPAVALTLNSLDVTYLLGPIAGSVLGMQVFRALSE